MQNKPLKKCCSDFLNTSLKLYKFIDVVCSVMLLKRIINLSDDQLLANND